jgi:hypothetical protein
MKTVRSIDEALKMGRGSYIASTNPFDHTQHLVLDIWTTDGDDDFSSTPYLEDWSAEGAVCTFSDCGDNLRGVYGIKAKVEETGHHFERVCHLIAQEESTVAISTVGDSAPDGGYCSAVWEKNPGDFRRAVERWLDKQK